MKDNFTEKLKKLEEISNDIEKEEIDLEESFELFDKGMKIAMECEKKLKELEKEINVIVEDNDL